jgi:hypothetical protein
MREGENRQVISVQEDRAVVEKGRSTRHNQKLTSFALGKAVRAD